MPVSSRGTSLGAGYVLRSPIGEGPTGTVWRGTTPDGAAVAIRVLHHIYASNPAVTARFAQFQAALTSLRSPQLVAVRALVIDAPTMAIVTDLIQGMSLREYLRQEGTLRPAHAFTLAEQILSALSAVHQAGLVHHDVKPENVLIDLRDPHEPQALLTNLGLVQGIGPAIYTALGPSPYRAPEQGPGQPEMTSSSDLFAVGAMLFEMLTGKPPEQRLTMLPVIPGLPTASATAVTSMLSVDPENRPHSAALARDQLIETAGALAGMPAAAPAPGTAEWQDSQRPTAQVGLPDWLADLFPDSPAQPIPQVSPAAAEPVAAVLDGSGRQRRLPLLIAALAVLVSAVVAAMVIWHPFSTGSAGRPTASKATAVTRPAATATPDSLASPLISSKAARQMKSASAAWGSVRDIANAFPKVIPSQPAHPGSAGQTCANVVVVSEFSTGKVLCKYASGQVMSLQSYASVGDRDKRAAQIKGWTDAKATTTWRSGTGTAQRTGILITGVTDGEPWRWWTYDQAGRFAVYVRWPGHSPSDLRTWWNQHAPF